MYLTNTIHIINTICAIYGHFRRKYTTERTLYIVYTTYNLFCSSPPVHLILLQGHGVTHCMSFSMSPEMKNLQDIPALFPVLFTIAGFSKELSQPPVLPASHFIKLFWCWRCCSRFISCIVSSLTPSIIYVAVCLHGQCSKSILT